MAPDPPNDPPVDNVRAAAGAIDEAFDEADVAVAAAAARAALAAPLVVVEAATGTDSSPPLPNEPAEPSSPAREWGAAVGLMIVFGLIMAAFVSMWRGG